MSPVEVRATRVYHVVLVDGRERYIATDRPYELVDGRRDVEVCELVEGEALTPRVLCALVVDQAMTVWPEYQRKLAIDEMVRGSTLEHAVAAARRTICRCERCYLSDLAVAS